MTVTRKDVAALIRAERKARNLKRWEVARAVGAKPSWLRKKESGKARIYIPEFLALAKAIGFDAIAAVSKLKRQHDKPL
jgi:ribosome-binding protein aMBF1 (putative translation factor)